MSLTYIALFIYLFLVCLLILDSTILLTILFDSVHPFLWNALVALYVGNLYKKLKLIKPVGTNKVFRVCIAYLYSGLFIAKISTV